MHVHCNISSDSKAPIESVVKSAIAKGLNGICFTDHVELFNPRVIGKEDHETFDVWQKSYQEIAQMRTNVGDEIEILHGMELSGIEMDVERSKKYIQSPDIDFVLGSTHMIKGYVDFCFMTFPHIQFCKEIMKEYLDTIICMAKLGLADSIAHVGYAQRYMVRQGFSVNLMDYEDQLRQLFIIMVQTGQGLEINTSGLRQGAGATFPNIGALRLYKELGGEIVTIGSDSHLAHDVGSHFKEAMDMLTEVGFKYAAVFRQRKAHFIKV